jgi:hypothetical protein
MTAEQRFNDRDILERYTDQPARLPESVRRVLAHPGSEPELVCYALADLDERLAFASTWLVLTATELIIARTGRDQSCDLSRFPRSNLSKVDLSTGLSCHALRVYGSAAGDGDTSSLTLLVELRFTHRQRRSMEGLSFLLEQITEGIALDARDADRPF